MKDLLENSFSNPNLRGALFDSICVFINLFGYTQDLVLINYSKLYLKVHVAEIFGATLLHVYAILTACLIDPHIRSMVVEVLIRVFFPIFFIY